MDRKLEFINIIHDFVDKSQEKISYPNIYHLPDVN